MACGVAIRTRAGADGAAGEPCRSSTIAISISLVSSAAVNLPPPPVTVSVRQGLDVLVAPVKNLERNIESTDPAIPTQETRQRRGSSWRYGRRTRLQRKSQKLPSTKHQAPTRGYRSRLSRLCIVSILIGHAQVCLTDINIVQIRSTFLRRDFCHPFISSDHEQGQRKKIENTRMVTCAKREQLLNGSRCEVRQHPCDGHEEGANSCVVIQRTHPGRFVCHPCIKHVELESRLCSLHQQRMKGRGGRGGVERPCSCDRTMTGNISETRTISVLEWTAILEYNQQTAAIRIENTSYTLPYPPSLTILHRP